MKSGDEKNKFELKGPHTAEETEESGSLRNASTHSLLACVCLDPFFCVKPQ